MHHSRRRSGHGVPNTSMTDVRKAAAPADNTSSRYKSSKTSSTTGRRSAGAHGASRPSKTGRDAEKERDDDPWFEDERESFPQYCMTCEKQFVAKDDRFLYCSEACRDYDQEYGTAISTQHFYANGSAYPVYAIDNSEPRDIIPRAAPSRPSSTYFSPPSTPSAVTRTSSTLPATSAIAALRSLSIRDSSPPSPTMASSASSIWPFATRSAAASPSTSYARSSASGMFASTYDTGYYRSGAPHHQYYGSAVGVSAADRPLPSRRPGSHARPKSIELVTPLIGQ